MEHLIQITERSTVLAAFAALALWRVKSASLRHAVWTLIAAGMLIETVLGGLLPSLPLPVLHPVELAASSSASSISISISQATRPLIWPLVAMAIYFAGVLFFLLRLTRALIFTRRLVRRSERIAPGRYQSSEITVPMTAGSKILLPPAWRDWDSAKLDAVIAHEQSHVRRRDSLVSLIARLNRCALWFHPLAWWIEHELARLAELACDDAALAIVPDREQYARTLLDMARTVHDSRGRLLTAQMAKEANLETRIDRILDRARRLPKALGRRGWLALVAVAAPVIYFVAAAELAPAQTLLPIPAPQAPRAPEAPTLVAQAPEPAAPPVPAAVPQPQAAPQPEAPQRDIIEMDRQLTELQEALRAAEMQQLQQQRETVESQRQKNLEQLRLAQAMQRLQEAESQLRQRQAQTDAGVSVTVAPERNVTVSIALGPAAQGEAIAQVSSDDGGGVKLGLRHGITTPNSTWDVPLSLKPGSYELKVLIRNTADGTISTKVTRFDVR